jgi:peptidoglycan/LPS O-acetylase OafA/YrhL
MAEPPAPTTNSDLNLPGRVIKREGRAAGRNARRGTPVAARSEPEDETIFRFESMGTLRLILALAVVIAHSGGIFGFHVFSGVYAVQVFYLISGFLIAFILSERYGTDKYWLFYSNRALRIFLPYYFVWGATLLLSVIVLAVTGSAMLNFSVLVDTAQDFSWPTWAYVVLTNAGILGQDVGLFLRYAGGDLFFTTQYWVSAPQVNQFQLLPQSWSMALELMFYLLAPFLVRLGSLPLTAIIGASLALRALAFHNGYLNDPWLYRFFPFELAAFLGGVLAYRLYAHPYARALAFKVPALIYVGTAVAVAVVVGFGEPLYLYSRYFAKGTSWGGYPWGMYVFLGLSLPFLFHFSKRHAWDRALGDLSYPAYLIHWPVLAVMPVVLPDGLQKDWQGFATTVLTVIFSALFAVYVERPIDRWRAQRVEQSGARRAAAHLA